MNIGYTRTGRGRKKRNPSVQDFYRWRRQGRTCCSARNQRAKTLPSVGKTVKVDNLLAIFDDLKRNAGQAPGLDGLTYQQVSRSEAAEVLREISREIKQGTYRPHPCRELEIPKQTGGYRTLRIAGIVDRIVASAVHRAVEPFLEKQFLKKSHGFRPERNPWTMLAQLEIMVKVSGRKVLVNNDVRQAFDHVLIDRLLEYHTRFITDQEMLNLIEVVLRGNNQERRIGIHQGNPYSPTALNLYLHLAHDLGLEKDHGFPFWLRYADNLVYLTQSVPEGHQIQEWSGNLLQRAGLSLKLENQKALCNLAEGDTTELLGYQLSYQKEAIHYTMTHNSWENLKKNLVEAHQKANPVEAVKATIDGWLNWCGPTFASQEREVFLQRILCLTSQQGIQEISQESLWQKWKGSWNRWCSQRRNSWAAHHKGSA